MPKKKEKDLSETLAELFSDPVANYDAISAAIREQREKLVDIRDAAQSHLEWLGALQAGLQSNLLKSLDKH